MTSSRSGSVGVRSPGVMHASVAAASSAVNPSRSIDRERRRCVTQSHEQHGHSSVLRGMGVHGTMRHETQADSADTFRLPRCEGQEVGRIIERPKISRH